jgi:perosamine synthetase
MNFQSWPIVEDEHIQAVAQIVRSGQWHYGTIYKDLERDLSREYKRHAVATASCAWAIYLLIRSIPSVRTVAVPAYTYYGTVHPVIWASARPVFVDVDPHTFNMCPQALRRTARDHQLDAVLAVHLHGLPFSTDIRSVCEEFSLLLFEDVCQAQGASALGIKAGCTGAAAAFSFNSRKTLPAGLGGAVLFESEDLARRAAEIRDYGRKTADGLIEEIGSYLPIGEFDAVLARVQLSRLPQWLEHADAMARILSSALGPRAPVVPPGYVHAWHKYRIRGTREEQQRLAARGVVTSNWMSQPLTVYPAYAEYVCGGEYPGATEICRNTFCLFDDERPIVAQSVETIQEIAETISRELI